MYNPTTRLLAILELLQARGTVSGLELAQTLEVEERSIRRYIMMLRDIGIPIEGERGRHGGYSLRPGFRLPPLMFNLNEITAVIMGLSLMRDLAAPSLLAVESASAKIARVLPEELEHYADALCQSLVMDNVQLGTYRVSNEQIIAFSRAAHEQTCMDMTYRAAEGDLTERTIAPYGVVLHARTWYVPAYCYLRRDLRIFRLDRIEAFVPTQQTFTRPENFDARAAVLDSLARIPSTHTFEVLLHVSLATAQEIVPPSLAVLESVEGGQTLLRCYSDDPHWFARYLARLEVSFTVLSDEALREAMRVLAGELLSSMTPQIHHPE
jgi:predicted DNA-binding transcriptional regulator YafY